MQGFGQKAPGGSLLLAVVFGCSAKAVPLIFRCRAGTLRSRVSDYGFACAFRYPLPRMARLEEAGSWHAPQAFHSQDEEKGIDLQWKTRVPPPRGPSLAKRLDLPGHRPAPSSHWPAGWLPTPEGLSFAGKMALALMVAGIFLWVTEPVPVAVSGLVIMARLPHVRRPALPERHRRRHGRHHHRRVGRVHQQRDLLHPGVVRHHRRPAEDEDPREDRVRPAAA